MAHRTVGDIQINFRNRGAISMEWTIPQFLPLLEEVGSFYACPLVDFCKRYLLLRIINDRQAWIGLEVWIVNWSDYRLKRLTLGVRKADKTEHVLFHDQKYPDNTSFWHTDKFLKKIELFSHKKDLAPANTLTLTCLLYIDSNEFLVMPVVGNIQEQGCFYHKQIEWKICRDLDFFASPEFNIGSQRYKLVLSFSLSSMWVMLSIYRIGESIDSPSRFPRWWVEIKPNDISSRHINFKGQLDLIKECESWSPIPLLKIRQSVLNKNNTFVIIFRLSVDQALRPINECLHGAAKILQPGVGPIQEKECKTHKHLEWEIDYDTLQYKRNVTSPCFIVGSQSYKLELSYSSFSDEQCSKLLSLHLYSSRPADVINSSRPIRWFAGIKRYDGYYALHNECGSLNLKEEGDLWTQKCLFQMMKNERKFFFQLLNATRCLTVVFRLDKPIGRTKDRECPGLCFHDLLMQKEVFVRGLGSIREEMCSSHKHVEWDIQIQWEQVPVLKSPEFTVGSQRFRLMIGEKNQMIDMNLYSRGPPPRVSHRWWMGFKGHYRPYSCSTSGVLDAEEQCYMWTCKHSYSVSKKGLVINDFASRGQLNMFFCMNSDEKEATAVACPNDDAESWIWSAERYWSIPEEYPSYTQMEWKIHPEHQYINYSLELKKHSPVFKIGTHLFTLKLFQGLESADKKYIELCLYSKGTSTAGHISSLHWCAALKLADGTYHLRTLRGELDLKEGSEIWTRRGSKKFFGEDLMSQVMLKTFTVVFRLNKKQSLTRMNPCIPNILEFPFLQDFGNIKKEEFSFHIEVEWSVDYCKLSQSRPVVIVSPKFTFGTQTYVLELSPASNTEDSMALCLYKFGSAVSGPSRFVRWWAGFKRRNGIYHFKNQKGELDLKAECDVWTQIYLHTVDLYELDKDLITDNDCLTTFFRMGIKQANKAKFYNVKETQQVAKRQRKDDDNNVIFLVKDMEFNVPKVFIKVEVPAFNSVLLHDVVKSGTNVFSILDIEPAVVDELLYYICTGFVRKLTARKALDLYMVARKYSDNGLQADCLQCICDTLSVSNFCDVVKLALKYDDDDLMKEVITFFSQNWKIVETDHWKKLCSDRPAETNILLMRTFLPQERADLVSPIISFQA